MTSSWLLQQRKKMVDVWNTDNFGNKDSPLGGVEDYYITPGHTHECHPNYTAIPIGNSYGFMICSKKTHPDGSSLDLPYKQPDLSKYNGFHRFQADLYAPPFDKNGNEPLPRQISNPDGYYDRVIPNEKEFHRDDYIARGIKFNGTGINPVHTPSIKGCKYDEYGFDYTPNPPYKYDVQRLNQPYVLWRNEQKFKGISDAELDNFDKEYNKSSTMGVW